MAINAVCPGCRASSTVPDAMRGKEVRCKNCETTFVVGAAAKAAKAVELGSLDDEEDVVEVESAEDTPRPTKRPDSITAKRGPMPRTEDRLVAKGTSKDLRALPDKGSSNGAKRKANSWEDEEELEEGLGKSRSLAKKPAKRGSGAMPLIIGGAVGGGILLVGGVVLAFVLMNQGTPKNEVDTKLAQIPRDQPSLIKTPTEQNNNTSPPIIEPKPKVEFNPPVVKPPEERVVTTVPTIQGGQLAPEVLKRVKAATTFIRVTRNDGIASGSGFLALDSGLVLTNAHVVGMLVPGSDPPKSAEIFLNYGQPDEKKMMGKVLGVDSRNDLAVLRVDAKGLPPLLPVSSAMELQETQEIYIFGYPLGDSLGKEITVSVTQVNSFRKDEYGVLNKIQVSGGMTHGNSGGPIVDRSGRVIGVVVSGLGGIEGTFINFAIPGDYVQAIMNGRITGMEMGQPYYSGSIVKVPVTVRLLDPLNRVRKVGVDCWTGNPAPKPRPPSLAQPAPMPGDSEVQSVSLTYKDGVATGELILNSLSSGKVFWAQPNFSTGDNTRQWGLANIYTLPDAVERKPIMLALKHYPGTKANLALNSKQTFKLGGGERSMVTNMAAKMVENTLRLDGNGTADVYMQYSKLDLSEGRDRMTIPRNPALPKLIRNVGIQLRVDKFGNLIQNKADLSKVPAASREELKNMSDQIQQSLEAVSVPLPGSEVKVGQIWKEIRSLPIDTPGKFETGKVDMTYTYLGVRTRNSREEAVVGLSGTVRPLRRDMKLSGKATGTAVVDLRSGLVTEALVSVDVDMTVVIGREPTHLNGTLEVKLLRTLPANLQGVPASGG